MAPDKAAPATVRISKIAGRYLVFDPAAVALLRRDYNTCGNLVGTVPQQPSQNMLLGLPIELRPEEAESLVHRGAAHVVDDVAAHQSALRSGDRSAYIESLRRKKRSAQRVLAEATAKRAAEVADKYGRQRAPLQRKTPEQTPEDSDAIPLFETPSPDASTKTKVELQVGLGGVTPTTSQELVSPDVYDQFRVGQVPPYPLARFLQSSGYYMTPGLRFGARYSVYPGDPLRFHAHYMANQYEWNEAIPILDIVEGGRLATAVKKAFLIGGEEPSQDDAPGSQNPMRTYSIEWASM
ncbi:tRNA-splicing endonuclease subunit tsp-like protein [Hapsidospora chrysogenum ATCC 11550]|uniref:tRNA-splicing endonuclease subunit Sen34 n=1 Tax=Hapsidospora chrysogenum (strain ATCC 11550 / CBS 779.69 / DSM 880 / IAM 14645 / JCM 23072 / IMI 49137) TaxID=857340 RepID=A0A086SYY5_HAPC1|nr:tRNA-splicing endonuclease subunit tsp-like protein [Hapsidospora chrysogenum ATCC 11550]